MNFLREKTAKILVLGDLMIDDYLWGEANRISPEAPVLVVDIKNETKSLGGAGNVLKNLLALNAKADIISLVGDDKTAQELAIELKNLNVSTEFLLTDKSRTTSRKTRLIATHQQVVRFDKESTQELEKTLETKIISLLKKVLKNYDCLLISDYNKGLLSHSLTQEAIKQARTLKIPVLVDPKGYDYSKYKGATTLTPNKKEAQIATKMSITDKISLELACKKLKQDLSLDYATITLSEGGIAIFDDTLHIIPALAKEVFDVTGAGDTVLATLGLCLALKQDKLKAAQIANIAAAIVVGKVGSAVASLDEISMFLELDNLVFDNATSFAARLNSLRKMSKKIVFTNGCFDVLHKGHISYLSASKSMGDVLVVGLNSDKSVQKLKGKNRPINSQEDRAYLLSSLKCVDFVVIFDDDTPLDLIKLIKPDVLTKGADYKNKKVVGQEFAQELVLIDFVNGYSSTEIINKIRKNK